MDQALLQVNNISKNFDRLSVLGNVSFTLAKGEVIGLVGRQGAGKSTLFHILSGAIPPSSGQITFDGSKRRFNNRIEAQKLGIETVYQTSSLINHFDFSNQIFFDSGSGIEVNRRTSGLVEQFNVAQNILLGHEPKKFSLFGVIDWEQMTHVAQELLAEFDLPPSLAYEPVSNLADEQRQIILLLRALQRPCQLLLLDDIIPILSFKRQEILLSKIKKLASQGVSIIISSDDLKHLFTITDRIIVLYEGKLVADRQTAESTPREIVELMVGSTKQEQVSPLIWALESYHTAQQQTEELRRAQASLQQSLHAQDSLNRQLVERLSNQLLALDKLNAALQATQRRLITEREDERKALARELHDQVIQDILGLIYQLEDVEELASSLGLSKKVNSVRHDMRNLVSELRQMCSDLRPPTIDHHGLHAAINSLATEWSNRNGIPIHLEVAPDLG
ncbi:MAG TPA: ABC transporter, partial [Anaerolineae bacterium]|nr:ABC transporter [Anaerolineae bacterium]